VFLYSVSQLLFALPISGTLIVWVRVGRVVLETGACKLALRLPVVVTLLGSPENDERRDDCCDGDTSNDTSGNRSYGPDWNHSLEEARGKVSKAHPAEIDEGLIHLKLTHTRGEAERIPSLKASNSGVTGVFGRRARDQVTDAS